jgi:Tfp pilus assembly protein PilF
MSLDRLTRAWELLQEAYKHQMEGDYELAVDFYQRSLETYPTAEAYTFLGWTYHFQGKLDQAIAECKKAIQVDPDFGNPYNDIGAYLIEKGQLDEAATWLEKALASKRYASYHYPHYNLGRIYLAKDMLNRARECFERALEIEPGYELAREALAQLRRKVM